MVDRESLRAHSKYTVLCKLTKPHFAQDKEGEMPMEFKKIAGSVIEAKGNAIKMQISTDLVKVIAWGGMESLEQL